MLKFILRRQLRKFEADFGYDASYMHAILDIWPGAGLRYLGLSSFSQMQGPAPEVWAGALLASTLDGDCGPCVQLVADMGVRSGVAPEDLAACLARDFDAAGAAGLGFRFAEAAISDLSEAEDLRLEILEKFGEKAVISASYAAAVGRSFPVLKRAVGHGKTCQQIKLGGAVHPVVRQVV